MRILKRGHALTFAGLFLFTIILYFRPYETFPSLSFLSSSAFWIAIVTLGVFIPTQLGLEGSLTVRPREINLVLLFTLTGLLSVPLAINPGEAWTGFGGLFKAVLIFIVIVNVVRTERRLKTLLLLALAVSCVLSVAAINDYRVGNLMGAEYRVEGFIGGMFGNPNDLALHLVTMVPIAFVLALTSRGLFRIGYGILGVLFFSGIVVTFSRGGFLGIAAAMAVLIWKLGRRWRISAGIAMLVLLLGFFVLAPGGYGARMSSILDSSLDSTGSATARWGVLIRSLNVAIRNPLFGVGMENMHIVSFHEQVSHNAYTQVAGEMGIFGFAFYVMFMVTPIRRLGVIERESAKEKSLSWFYFTAVGLQASIIGYMVSSFFASVAYQWYLYYLIGYAVSLRRLYDPSDGKLLTTNPRALTDTANEIECKQSNMFRN